MKNDRQNTKMLKGIKAKLLKILLPCIAIAIISIIIHYCDFLYGF